MTKLDKQMLLSCGVIFAVMLGFVAFSNAMPWWAVALMLFPCLVPAALVLVRMLRLRGVPEEEVSAQVSSKHRESDGDSTTFLASFRLSDGRELEFKLTKKEWKAMEEGQAGTLRFKENGKLRAFLWFDSYD